MKEKKRKFRHEHGGSFSVDYYAYASRMRSWNAGFKVLFSIISLLLCIACNNLFVSLAVIFFMGFLTVAVGGLKLHHYISMLLVPIIFLIFGTIAIAIGFSMHPVGQYHVHFLNLFYIYCSKASLLKAGNLVFKALGAVSALYMMTLTTPLNMIYRYIFIMIDTHSRMKNSAESRLGYCDFKTSCYSFGQVASNLLVVSLKRGNNYYNALEARCYNGDLQFLEEEKQVKAGQVVMAVIFIIILLLIWFFTK